MCQETGEYVNLVSVNESIFLNYSFLGQMLTPDLRTAVQLNLLMITATWVTQELAHEPL